jgi:glycosyltransferase involved in cell wall biosynthesis
LQLHVLSTFRNAFGGTEQGIIEIHRLLAGRCDLTLWSEAPPDARIDLPVRRVDPAIGALPDGGTLLVHGNYFTPGDWLERVRVDRLILGYNTLIGGEMKYSLIERLRRIGRLEIVYGSQLTRRFVGEPGTVLYSRIDLGRFRAVPLAARPAFTLGRLSRDVLYKHHPEDLEVYRHFALRGASARIMGGTCLARKFGAGGAEGIELLAAGAESAEAFLASLDCFFYRTATNWVEAGGRVVAEAMACGLPVVGHHRHGFNEWVEHGISGFLFDSTAEAVEILQRLQADPTLRSRVGSAARVRIEALFSPAADEAYARFFLATP